MLRSALLGALALACASAARADQFARCIDAGVPKSAITAHNGKWIAVTNDQRMFLAGVYAMNPQTPPGLPYGDKAVLATVPSNPGGMVFFIDGGGACTPMPIPKQMVDMLSDIAAGVVNHEASH